jgi:hypothetical protein
MYNQPFTMVFHDTIDGGDEHDFCHGFPGTCQLIAAYFMPSTTLAAHNDNHQTVTLKKGTGGTAIATFSTDANAGGTYDNISLAKGTAQAITITGTGANIEFGATTALEIVVAEGGTTAALDGSWTFRWQPIRVP